MNKQETRTLQGAELRIQSDADGQTLSGLVPYNSLSCDLGGWKELISPGAFAGALDANADVLCLRDHDASLLLGRTKSKTLLLNDSPDGLRFSCKLPKTSQASDLAESVTRGDLDANSFGFICLEDKWVADETGSVIRTLLSVELLEVSPCSFPAYPSSAVSVRSLPSTIPVEIRSKLEKRSDEDNDGDPNDKGCECSCPECVDDNCDGCSDEDCTDPNCSEERNADANRVLALRIELLSE
jgi:uncharacterized protein